MSDPPLDARSALGLDAGGSATRWALVGTDGRLLGEGDAAAMTGLQLLDPKGMAALDATVGSIAAALPQRPAAAFAGVTGLDRDGAKLFVARLARALSLPPDAVFAASDIELLCRASFPSGEGIVLYAGTGSIAARLDAGGVLHRAGGRGHLIDDAGGGHWIAREALKAVWREEDRKPGAWYDSALARSVFDAIGSHEWARTREFVYANGSGARGRLGRLALAVAAAAGHDAAAHSILERAGVELALLAGTMLGRFGMLPLLLAGRVFELHPVIEASLRAALPCDIAVERATEPPQRAAARLALGQLAASA